MLWIRIILIKKSSSEEKNALVSMVNFDPDIILFQEQLGKVFARLEEEVQPEAWVHLSQFETQSIFFLQNITTGTV